MPLYVPNTAVQERRASFLRSQVERHREAFRYWNPKLKEIDRDLELVKASEDANVPELKPGYWHVFRYRPGSPPTVIVHENPETGGYMDPNSYLLERLARGDMWNDRAVKEMAKLKKKAQRAAEREEEREAEERVEELTQRIRSLKSTQIHIPRTPSVSGSDEQGSSGPRGI